jgi:hypothetical protein
MPQAAIPTGAFDAVFTGPGSVGSLEDTAEAPAVVEGVTGPTLLARAALALGWVGFWRGTAPKRDERRSSFARPA